MHFNRFFRNTIQAIIVCFTLPCCNNAPVENTPVNDTARQAAKTYNKDSTKTPNPDIDTADFAIEYVAIADTGLSYYKLRTEMFDLHKSLGWTIDTMGRYYDVGKNKIVLSDTAEDEIYRGEYFERRFPSECLSLEYYNRYCDSSSAKNMALVCGLYETKSSADSLLLFLKHNSPHAFVQRAKMYMGCEH